MTPEVHCGEGDHLMPDRGDQTAQAGRVLDLRKADGMYGRERTTGSADSRARHRRLAGASCETCCTGWS